MAGKDRRQISVKGGGKLLIRQIDPAPSDAFVDVGYLKNVKLSDTYNMVESIDAAGNFVDTKEAGEKVMLTGELMQTAKEQIDFQRAAAGEYHEAYYLVKLNNGNSQEFSFVLCRIKPGAVLDFKPGERTIALEIHAIVPKADFVRTPTDYNVTENTLYVLIENSVAVGPPTDTASSVQAAVI